MRIFSALILTLILCFTAQWSAAADYDEQLHPDGSLAYKIRLDRDGERHGRYRIYHPSGDAKRKGPVAEVGQYDHGQLHGTRQVIAADKTLLQEEIWLRGRLLFPISERLLEQRLKACEESATLAIDSLPDPLPDPQAPARKHLVDTLTRLNQYRVLCGLPGDVTMRADYIRFAQCAAEVCDAMDKLDHNPKSNPGLSEERWQDGKIGCAKSNLAMGNIGPSAVDSYMDDSDDKNRSRVGHRRWILWDRLATVGTGHSGRYSALYVVGDKRPEPAEAPLIAFPPRGLMPMNMFGPRYCWHVSPNPDLYQIGKDAAMEIRPFDLRSGQTGEPLSLAYATLATGQIAGRSAIIAQPEQLTLRKQASYQVTITGVEATSDDLPALQWIVTFY